MQVCALPLQGILSLNKSIKGKMKHVCDAHLVGLTSADGLLALVT